MKTGHSLSRPGVIMLHAFICVFLRRFRFSVSTFQRFNAFIVLLLLTGCLFKPVTVSTHYFVLSPISTNQPAASTEARHTSVGIGLVQMPSYLLRDSMAIRNGANEIEYLENTLWAERLDRSFRQTVAANLSRLLPSDNIYLTDSAPRQLDVRVFIAVEQFDVDTHGRGVLTAQWRTTAADSDVALKSGTAQLTRAGDTPNSNPQIIARTLSELAAELSRDLSLSIRESSEKHFHAE